MQSNFLQANSVYFELTYNFPNYFLTYGLYDLSNFSCYETSYVVSKLEIYSLYRPDDNLLRMLINKPYKSSNFLNCFVIFYMHEGNEYYNFLESRKLLTNFYINVYLYTKLFKNFFIHITGLNFFIYFLILQIIFETKYNICLQIGSEFIYLFNFDLEIGVYLLFYRHISINIFKPPFNFSKVFNKLISYYNSQWLSNPIFTKNYPFKCISDADSLSAGHSQSLLATNSNNVFNTENRYYLDYNHQVDDLNETDSFDEEGNIKTNIEVKPEFLNILALNVCSNCQ